MTPVKFAPDKQQPITIDWAPGNMCNFSCHYCDPNINDGSLPWHSYDDCVRFIKYVWEHIQHPQTLNFNIHGGEPTLWPDLIPVCEYIKSLHNNNQIRLISNGTRNTAWWTQNSNVIDRVIVSIHYGQSRKEQIAEKFNAVQASGIDVSMHIMMDVLHFEECMSTYEYIYDNCPDIELLYKPVRETIAGSTMQNYNPDQIARMSALRGRHPHTTHQDASMFWHYADGTKREVQNIERDVILTRKNNWENWYCRVGVETLVVQHSGFIKNGSLCFMGVFQGHISDKDHNLPFLPVQCKYDSCYCLADLQTTKTLDLEPGSQYIDTDIHKLTYKIATRN